MKQKHKTMSIVLFAAMLLAIITVLVSSGKANADTTSSTDWHSATTAYFVIGRNQYYIGDPSLCVDMDSAPYIDPSSRRALVPVRDLADALGATTNWDASTQEVTVTTVVYNINMTIGSTTLTVDGQPQTMDATPVINNGRTYLPARYVAEALGYSVDWNAANQIVIIWPNDATEPTLSNDVINAINQGQQQNATKPAIVQMLDQALGVTMTAQVRSGGWWYDPSLNADRSPNSAIDQDKQNDKTFVRAMVGCSGGPNGVVTVSINCSQSVSNIGAVNVDISPLQNTLDAFSHDSATIQQAMAYVQKCITNAKATNGDPADKLPRSTFTTSDKIVIIAGQGGKPTFAGIQILIGEN